MIVGLSSLSDTYIMRNMPMTVKNHADYSDTSGFAGKLVTKERSSPV